MESQNVSKSQPRSTGRRAAVIVLGVLFVITAVVGAVGFDVWRVLFNPPLVKQTLTDEMVKSDLVAAVLQAFSEQRARQRVERGEALSGVDEPDIALLLSFVSLDDWRAIKKLLVTDDFINHLVSVSVDALYTWIDSPDPAPKLVWNMQPLKARVSGNEGKEAILTAYAALPQCKPEEVADFQARLSQVPPGVEVLYNLCQFPMPYRTDQIDDYVHALEIVNENVPLEFNFGKMLEESPSANPQAVKTLLRRVRFAAHWMWVLALVFLLALLALSRFDRRRLGIYAGIPLLVAGALTLLLAGAAQPLLANLISNALLAQTSELVRAEVSASLARLARLFFQPLWVQGAVMALGGAALLIIARIRVRQNA
ncbi:MAG: hypothetical protein HPY45_15140 [Anaerolineae bacterium]|nr:hypothetical protein [Anaerolineae bacterium]